ncbi:MAG: tetratricopeptide repeat protein, partial [Planctomycetes bacterium]|nr:tetratricopeptide repeat protein [Planctomycetota bacterium]
MRIPRKLAGLLRGRTQVLVLGAASLLAGGSGGCAWSQWNLFKDNSPPPPAPADSLVLEGDHFEPDKLRNAGPAAVELAGARELYRKKEYPQAEKAFRRLADNKKNPELVAEEARFYQGECLYREKKYPKASDIYDKLLKDFPSGAHREQAMKRIFDIGNYWLDDTRNEMRAARDKREGHHWLSWPSMDFVHWEQTKPLLDEEGRAVENLDRVVYNDLTGPLADEALFLAGSVKFFHEDYREADNYFTQLVEAHPHSKYAPQAVELAIISKHLSTGGPAYDARKVAEARALIFTAENSYPELASAKGDFLERQLQSCNLQNAQKDFMVAEFYRRTGHPGAAYFCYEIVRRRYPGSPLAQQATGHMQELEAKLAQTRAHTPPPPPPTAPRAPARPNAPAPTPGQGGRGNGPGQLEVAP